MFKIDPLGGFTPAQQNAAIAYSLAQSRRLVAAAIGDSLEANSYSSSATTKHWLSYGRLSWVRRFLGPGIQLSGANVFGTAGYTTAQIQSIQLPLALAVPNVGMIFVGGGTNDITNAGITAAQTVANTRETCRIITASGIFAVLFTPPPRTDSMTDALRKKRSQIILGYRDIAATNSMVLLADCETQMVDPLSATGAGKTGVNNSDGVHLTGLGAMWGGSIAADAARPFVNVIDQRFANVMDVYDATDNPEGNLLTNGLLTGSAGALGGTGVTGTCATSWTLDNFTSAGSVGSAAIIGSQETIDGIVYQKIATNPAVARTASADFTWRFRPTTTITAGLTAGNSLGMTAFSFVKPGAVGLLGVGARLAVNTNEFFSRDHQYLSGSNGLLDGTRYWGGWHETEPFVPPNTPTAITPCFEITQASGVAANFEVYIAQCAVRNIL